MDIIEALRIEFEKDPLNFGYANMNDAERLARLQICDQLGELTTYDVTFRTLLGYLTPTEYVEARTTLLSAASADQRNADAITILSTLGLDFGHPNTQTALDELFVKNTSLRDKLKALGRTKVSRLSIILAGENATIDDVIMARGKMTILSNKSDKNKKKQATKRRRASTEHCGPTKHTRSK